MNHTLPTPPPLPSQSLASSVDADNAPSSSVTTALSSLTTCVRTIVTTDLPYALCVLNTGLFGPSDGPQPPFLNTSTPEGLLVSQLQRLQPVRENQVAVCKLHCASVRHRASTSCCNATRRLQACALSASSPSRELVSCKATIDRSFQYSNHECAALSPQDTALVAISGSIFLVVAAFAFLWRRVRLAPRQQHDLQSAKAPSSSLSPTGILASIGDGVVQVANLLWKNTLLRRRRLGAFVMEQLLPLIFVSVLVLIANLDQFGTSPRGEDRLDTSAAGNQAFRLSSPETQRLVCVGLAPTSPTALGAPPSTLRSFYASGQSVLGLFFVLSFVKFVSGTTAAMVYEKEIKMREVMKIMGVSDGVLVVSWCLTSSLLTLPLVLALSLLLKFGRVFPTTPVATVVFVFWSLQVAMAAFARAMTPWFNRARAASIVSVLVWILLYFPYFAVQPKDASVKFPAALAPPTAFALAIDRLLREAQLGTGFAYSMTASMQPTLFNGVPTATEMAWFLLLDSVLLLVIGWYLENVLPQSFGVRKPWYFVFQPSFWRVSRPHGVSGQRLGHSMQAIDTYAVLGTPPAHRHDDDERLTQSPIAVVDVDDDAGAPIVEPVSSDLARQTSSSLQLHALTKVFPGRRSDGDAQPKRAVDALSLTLYSGQITALLGHNGAGKTTTISMLTGLIEPSSGDATMLGLSLRRDTDALRRLMGVCPQHDVLFPDLTVEEHLRFFATIKRQRLTAEDIDRALDAVALRGARRVLSKSLSGGQKRKLSVALALLGNSPLVFLDEPTSGMDPYSRRFTWDLLRRERDNRVMVLTTHFMDEADVLGDRIAILADGRLRCVGSSLFLKTRFGAGYKLTVIKSDDDASGGDENNLDDGDADPLLTLVRTYIPQATRTGDSGSERVYQLPVGDDGGAATVAVFPSLLDELDRRLNELKIRTYGLSVTTLEDVFLRIAGERDDESSSPSAGITLAPNRNPPSAPGKHVSETTIIEPPTGWDLYVALLTKRLRIARRDRKSLLHALGVPLLFLVVLLLLPEIQVASFLPDYASSLPSPSQQAACPADAIVRNMLSPSNRTRCERMFAYCNVGVIECDTAACCNAADYRSPWYACANCAQPVTPTSRSCPNSVCLRAQGSKLQVSLNAFVVAMITTLALAFVPAALIAYVVKEHEPTQDAKTLQCISGMNLASYWWANYTHDVALAVAAVAIAAVTLPFTSRTFASAEESAGVVLLVLVHGFAIVPMTYLYALKGGGRAGFTTYTRAQTSMLVFTLASGGLLSIFSFLCRVVDFSMGGGFTLSGLDRDYLRWVFLLFPGYALNNGLYEIGTRKLTRGALFGPERGGNPHSSFFGLARGFGKDLSCPACWNRSVAGCCVRDVMDVDVALAPILVQLVEAVLLMAVVLIIERRSQRPGQRSGSKPLAEKMEHAARPELDDEVQNAKEDRDVANERLRLDAERLDDSARDAAIVLRHVHHRYGDGRVALHDLSLAIPRGECFGYLGVNGAGKSTTIKILTQQVAATRGDVVVGGWSLNAAEAGGVKTRLASVVGYCPQFDALHDLLTVEEQLELYARIKGVPASMIPREVASVIDRLGLGEFRGRLTRGLSGGNKRKVSTAIALLGDPAIVILDEPSTGMDPSARRKMWNVIAAQCATKATSVLLTTHSMEECEALCSRVGILVKGRLQCLGSVEHLRQTHGRGFTVDLKLDTDPDSAQLEQLQTRVRHMLSTQPHVQQHSDIVTLGKDEITVVAAALGRPERAQVLASSNGSDDIQHDSGGSGGVGGGTRSLELLHRRFLEGDNIGDGDAAAGGPRLPLEVFCMWWQAQDRYDALEDFFSRRFEGSHVVEQHGDHFRFHIPKSHGVSEGSLGIRPREIFESVEQQRARLRIQEYSVSDTSLEHIFNAVASRGS